MTPHAYQRAGLLVIAFALVTIDVSILQGQRDPDDIDVETSIVNSALAVQLKNEMNAIEQPSAANPSTGKASINPPVNPSVGTLPRRPARRTVQNLVMEPRRLTPNSSAARTPPPYTGKPPAYTGNQAPAASPTNPTGTKNSAIIQASHMDPMQGLTRDGVDMQLKGQGRPRSQMMNSMVVTPSDRGGPLSATGSRYGAFGETPVERMSKMEAAVLDLERENDEIRQLNAGLQSRLKDSQDQLMSVIREVQSARKEMITARNDLDRLRHDLLSLREKIRAAQKEHSDVLQSMGPLLQQLLETDDVSLLPPNPSE